MRGDREVDRYERKIRLGPASVRVVVERDRDERGPVVQKLDLSRGPVHVGKRAEEVRDVEREDDIGICHNVLPCRAHVQRVGARDARTPLVGVGQIDDRRGEQIGQAEERPAGRRLAAERPHKNDGRSSLAESARCIFERLRVGLRRRRGLEPGQIR